MGPDETVAREDFARQVREHLDHEFSNLLTTGAEHARSKFLSLLTETFDQLFVEGRAAQRTEDSAPSPVATPPDDASPTEDIDAGSPKAFFASAISAIEELEAAPYTPAVWELLAARPCADSAFCPARNTDLLSFLDDDLRHSWLEWPAEYAALQDANPRLKLADMMQDISESDCASSWPHQEEELYDWVKSGRIKSAPFDDRYGVLTSEFFGELVRLQETIGGWVYYNDDTGCVEYANEDDWRAIRDERARQRAATPGPHTIVILDSAPEPPANEEPED